ncbi:MAG: hypothetical protein WBP29_14615 [Candidatus Zixiibacteriota bacterium]
MIQFVLSERIKELTALHKTARQMQGGWQTDWKIAHRDGESAAAGVAVSGSDWREDISQWFGRDDDELPR